MTTYNLQNNNEISTWQRARPHAHRAVCPTAPLTTGSVRTQPRCSVVWEDTTDSTHSRRIVSTDRHSVCVHGARGMLIGNLVPRREDALPACLPAQGQVLHTTKYWLPAHPTPTRAASGRRPSPNAQADGTNDDAAGSYTRATPPQSVHPNSVPLLKHAKSC